MPQGASSSGVLFCCQRIRLLIDLQDKIYSWFKLGNTKTYDWLQIVKIESNYQTKTIPTSNHNHTCIIINPHGKNKPLPHQPIPSRPNNTPSPI
jgi:hypothetical protein